MSRAHWSASRVVLVGTSHERAPVALRERIHLDPPAAARLARELAGDDGEAVCLSTCNRIEIYDLLAATEDAGLLLITHRLHGLDRFDEVIALGN